MSVKKWYREPVMKPFLYLRVLWCSCRFTHMIKLHKLNTHVSNSGKTYRVYTADAAAKSLQSCPTLCDPIDGSPLGSSVPGILQARILAAAAESLQSCRTLCDPIDGNPPGSPVPRILQARTLEWVAISFSNA